MNFLAHIYLSGTEKELIIGNFIADGIKGKKYLKYPPIIQKGILLHRAIDSFTDGHPTVRQSTARLHAKYSHYSGVIVDILYDHFLAKNWSQYHHEPLQTFVANFYALLQSHFHLLPPRIQRMTPHMIANNWLLSYATIEGISTILAQMNVRTKRLSRMDKAVIDLEAYYSEFETEFTSFFKDLIDFSNKKRNELLAQ